MTQATLLKRTASAHNARVNESADEVVIRKLQRATSGAAAAWDDNNVTSIVIGGGTAQTSLTVGGGAAYTGTTIGKTGVTDAFLGRITVSGAVAIGGATLPTTERLALYNNNAANTASQGMINVIQDSASAGVGAFTSEVYSTTVYPRFQGFRQRGTFASPATVITGDIILVISAGANHGGALSQTTAGDIAWIAQSVVGAVVSGMCVISTTSTASVDTNAIAWDDAQNTRVGSGRVIGWSSNTDPTVAANDTGFSRVSAGIVALGTGAAASAAGTLRVTAVQAPAATALSLGGGAATQVTIATTGLTTITATGTSGVAGLVVTATSLASGAVARFTRNASQFVELASFYAGAGGVLGLSRVTDNLVSSVIGNCAEGSGLQTGVCDLSVFGSAVRIGSDGNANSSGGIAFEFNPASLFSGTRYTTAVKWLIRDIAGYPLQGQAGMVFGWAPSTDVSAAIDTSISRVSPGVAAIGTGAAASAAGTLRVTSIQAPAATALNLGGAAASQWQIDTSGHLIPTTDNTRDLGITGTNRVRTGYFGTSVVIGATISIDGSSVQRTSSGAISLFTDALTTTITVGGGAAQTSMTLGKAGQTATFLGSLTVTQNLTVSGTTATVNATNLAVQDPLILLNSGAATQAFSGVAIERGSSGDDGLLLWNPTDTRFELGFFDTTGGTTAPSGALTSLAAFRASVLGLAGTTITFDGAGFVTATGATLNLGATGSNSIQLITNSTARWEVQATGHFVANTDNTLDIGASGATRPRTGYFGTSVVIGSTVTIGTSTVAGSAGLTVSSAAGALNVSSVGGGIGLSAGGATAISFTTNGSQRWRVQSDGHLTSPDVDTYDIGSSGVPNRSAYFATSVVVGTSGANVTTSSTGGITGNGVAITITSAAALSLVATGANNLTLTARGASTPFNDATDTALSGFTSASVIGALNELKSTGVSIANRVANTYTNNTGGTLVAGTGVYITTTASNIAKTDATADNALAQFIGVVRANIADTASGSVTTEGVESLAFVAGLTLVVGDEVFLSAATAGQFTNVAPSTSGNVVLSVGFVKVASTYTGSAGDLASVQLVRGGKVVV